MATFTNIFPERGKQPNISDFFNPAVFLPPNQGNRSVDLKGGLLLADGSLLIFENNTYVEVLQNKA